MTLKKWEELDVLDNYLINAVASDPEVAEPFFRRLISVLLQRNVGKIRVETEKFIPGATPEKRGIRLDVEVDEYLSDGKDESTVANVYDIEPHLKNDAAFPKLMRFRQAKLDSRHMKRGDSDFEHMPDLYVILITNFDVFDRDYMIYTFRQTCKEDPGIEYDDGLTVLYFNTNGSRGGSREVENMLKYLQDSRGAMAVDEATKELDGYVDSVKNNAALRGIYMDFGYLMDSYVADEVSERLAQATEQLKQELKQELTHQVTEQVTEQVTLNTLRKNILEILADKGNVSKSLQDKISAISDPERLHSLLLLAARTQSVEEFDQRLNE